MVTELTNEIKPDEQLGVSDPLNSNADATQQQVQTPPSDPFSTLTSNEIIVQNGLIRSGNFVTNSAGWRIQASGNAEFNDGTFRGTLTAAAINIPDTTTANSFHVNTDGDAWWGATALASGVAWVKKDGSAKFTSGTIGGWTIGASTLVGGNITLDQANNKVTVGGATPITLDGAAGTITSNGSEWTLNGNGLILGTSKITTVVTDVSYSSSTAETDLISVSIPANLLGTSSAVLARIYISGFQKAASATYTFRLKYGSTTLASLNAPLLDADTFGPYLGYIDVILVAAGTTNSQEGSIFLFAGDGRINSTGNNPLLNATNGTSAIDSTSAQTLAVSFQSSANNANNKITMSHAIIQKIV